MCAHSLAYDEKPNYQVLKKILNPDGIPLGPLDFSTKGQSINVHTPNSKKVDSQKAATRQVNKAHNRLIKKKLHSERSTEPCTTWKKVQKEEKLIGLMNNEAAQESTRIREKYQESQELLNEANSFPQKFNYRQFPKSFYEPHQDFTSPDIFKKSRSPSWYKYTSTVSTGITESSTGLWPTISQFTLSEETNTDIYYYGIIIPVLLMLVLLALYFL